jgi:hypothetical protein
MTGAAAPVGAPRGGSLIKHIVSGKMFNRYLNADRYFITAPISRMQHPNRYFIIIELSGRVI